MALLRCARSLRPISSHYLRHEAPIGLRASTTQAEKTQTAVSATQAAAEKQGGSKTSEEEWTEVIDEKSGQTYYWNQKTGTKA